MSLNPCELQSLWPGSWYGVVSEEYRDEDSLIREIKELEFQARRLRYCANPVDRQRKEFYQQLASRLRRRLTEKGGARLIQAALAAESNGREG